MYVAAAPIYVAALAIYVAAARTYMWLQHQYMWLQHWKSTKTFELNFFVKLSPSSSQIQLQLGLSLASFPNYPTTRPMHSNLAEKREYHFDEFIQCGF